MMNNQSMKTGMQNDQIGQDIKSVALCCPVVPNILLSKITYELRKLESSYLLLQYHKAARNTNY